MMTAYDKIYLNDARTVLGRMLDYAVYDLGYDIDHFFDLFISSGYAEQFGSGDHTLLAGMSGVELARLVIEKSLTKRVKTEPRYTANRSPEYWAGWSLAYYQWSTALSFREIVGAIPLSEVLGLYSPYHEMDIRQFCDKISKLYKLRRPETNLKRLRTAAGITQKELAAQSGVPLRTLQQYEQRQKNINKAQAEYVISLAKVLCCHPVMLVEKVE